MDEEGSSTTAMTKTWGFRRSTIARREFMEAIDSGDSSPPIQRRRGRPSRGRGRGRGKRADESGVTAVASKRGRGGRGHVLVPELTVADKPSSEHEARADAERVQCVAAELKSGEECASEGVTSDRAEDSDDLNLQEIRQRAVARRLQELNHEDNVDMRSVEDIDLGVRLLMKQEANVFDGTDITSKEEKVCSSTATGASGNSVAAAGARKATGGRRAKRAKKDCELADEEHQDEEQEEFSENSEEDTERMNQDTVCCTCQQGHSNRLMICCDSCQKWRHVDCVGIAEACTPLLQRNRQYVCPSCSDERDATSKNRTTNGLSEKHEIDSTHVVGIEQLVEDGMKAEEKAALPKCIGPGCSNDSLPESVYCSHQCIVRHAAAAMKSLSEPKTETKPAAPPADPPLKSEKRSFLAKLFKVKISKTPAQEERVSKQELDEESLCSATVIEPVQSATPSSPAPEYKPTVKDEVECNTSTPQSQPSDLTLNMSSSEKTPAAPLIKKSTPGRAKKTMPGSPRLELLKGALSKSPLPFPKKPPEVVPCGPWADEPAAAPHASPLLMRQNIRRLLSTVLFRRFSQSDDLRISESEIEKMAVDMEKEMFNMCYTTDEEYKNKYQYLVLTLKEPQNKELCHQVLKGNMPSVKLIQLSQQEESAADPLLQISMKKESSLFSEDVEEPAAPPEKVMSVDTTTSPSATTPSEEKSSLKLPQAKEISLGAPDVTSCMLKDTTAEHKRHLFDLNCRICTGQVSTDDPETKKPKMTMTKDETEKEKSSGVVHVIDEALDPPALDSDTFESPASPSGEDLNSQIPSAEFSPVLIPSVPTVSISRRDPRTAQYRQAPPSSAVSESASIPQQHPHPVKNAPESLKETLPPHVSVPLPAPMPKSILMKPPPASLDTSYGSMTRLANCDKGTKQFLSKQSILWKGFLNMPTVAKFVTKGYLISGSPDLLKEDLPDTIHIGGRILPQTVWEYVDMIKTSEAKELSLIRFHPSSEEEEVAYVSLFSYFNSRRRFGVVSNICKHIKDLYLIPLSTKQSIPAVLLPIEGPGLEQNHPNLLIGLAVCQKPKRPEGLPQDVGEKNSRSLMCSDGKGTSNPTSLNDPGQHSIKACDADIFLDSNPAGSLPSVGLPDPSCSASSLCAPSSLPSVSNPTPSVTVGPSKDSTSTTPLQTILNTLFGQKKQLSEVTECKISSLTDKVQICQQTCKDDDAMILGDDRPYDPEEYDPACSNEAVGSFSPVLEPKGPSAVADDDDDDDDRPYDPEEEYSAVGDTVRNNTPKASEAKHMEETSMVTSDIAYDPEDETMFEEMQNYLTSNAIPHKSTFCENNMSHYKDNTSVTTFSEQQKILEELNRQIEEQKRQLEEQTETLRLQKEAIGVSMAHFSVSKALMSPTHFDRDEEESIENIPYCQIIHQNRDPRICRNTSQDMPLYDTECEAIDKESAEKLLNTEEATNVVLNKSFTTKKEKLASDKAMPKEGSPDTKSAQLKNTKCSHSEYTHKNQDSRRSTLSTYRSSRRRSWHEHGSHHQDGASSRASRTVRSSKDVSDKHHRSKHSAGHLSRGCYSDKKGVTTSRKRHYHHHRDSSSPPRYRMRRHYSPVSHSSRRDKSSHDDSDQSRKTDLSEYSTKSSQHESGQVPDSDSIQSAYTSGQSVKVEGEAANGKDKRLADVQKGGPPNTKHEADRNQGLQTFQNPAEGSSQPLLNKAIDKNLPLSVLSEMKRENLPPNQTDSSNQEALLPTPCLAHGATDLPLHRDSPALQPSGIQTDVFHHDTQPPHNQTDRFSESGQIDQKRKMSSIQRPNYSHNETDQLHSGDYPQRAFRLQYRNSSQSDTDQFYSRELPQNKRGKFLHDGDNNKQPYVSHKQEEFSTDKCVHQKHPNHRLRRFPVEATDQVHQSQPPRPDQLHECNFEEPETAGLCHKKYTSYKQGQNFHEDESVQFQQRESLLGPPPVHKGSFRPPNPREHFHPSTFDKWKPLRERPSVMKRRSPEFAQPRDGNSGSSTNFGPRGQSSGFVRYEGPTKDPQPSGPFTEEMFESPGPARPIGSKDPSPRQRSFRRGRGSHRGSRQVMHDRTHLMNSSKQMSIPNVEGPTERQIDARGSHTTPTSKSHMPHLANPSGYAQDICELHSPDCHQTFAEDAEDRIRTGFSRQAPSHSQDTAHGATHSRFEGQQYTEIKGQPRGRFQRFRGRRRGIVGPFHARDHKNNAQVRGPRFDSPQRFLGQREPSLDLHRRRRPSPQNCDGFDDHNETHSSDFPNHSTTTPTHFTKPQHQHLGQPPANLECRLRQTNIRPLRLSGPLLPTPPGGPIRQNLSRGHGQNSHNECHRDYLT